MHNVYFCIFLHFSSQYVFIDYYFSKMIINPRPGIEILKNDCINACSLYFAKSFAGSRLAGSDPAKTPQGTPQESAQEIGFWGFLAPNIF